MSDLHKQHVSNTLGTIGAGAALGGTIGSIFPGAGTAIGAGIGAVVGGIAGLIGGGNTHAKMRKRIYNAQQQTMRNNIPDDEPVMWMAAEEDSWNQT